MLWQKCQQSIRIVQDSNPWPIHMQAIQFISFFLLEHALSFKTYKKPFSTQMMILNLSEEKNYKIKQRCVKELVSNLFEHQET